MEYIKNKIIPILMGSFLTGLVALILSIVSDVLPIIYPSLQSISSSLYLKLLLLLLQLLCVALCMLLFFYNMSKQFKPFKKSGKYAGLKWIADIKEYDPLRGWDIWVNFICPKHGVYMGRKDAQVPNCCYGVLWCSHCNKEYPFKVGDAVIHLEEVENIIKDKVISGLRVKS